MKQKLAVTSMAHSMRINSSILLPGRDQPFDGRKPPLNTVLTHESFPFNPQPISTASGRHSTMIFYVMTCMYDFCMEKQEKKQLIREKRKKGEKRRSMLDAMVVSSM